MPQRRPSLSRRAIAAEALALLDEQGPEELTMRALAVRLGTAPMSLYRYFSSRDELLDGAYELILGELVLPPTEGTAWDVWARASWSAYRATLLQHRRAVGVVVRWQGGSRTAGLVGLTDTVIGVLRRGGFTAHQAVHIQRVLTTFTIGLVFVEASWLERRDPEIETPTGDHPHYAAGRHDLEHPDFDETFSLGLEALLAGFATLLVPGS